MKGATIMKIHYLSMEYLVSGYIIGQMTMEMNGIPICIAYHKQQNVNITHHQRNIFWIGSTLGLEKEDLANYYGRTYEG